MRCDRSQSAHYNNNSEQHCAAFTYNVQFTARYQ